MSRKNFSNQREKPEENQSLSDVWQQNVTNKKQAHQFFSQYFTHYPSALQLAMANYIDQGIKDGTLPDYMLRQKKEQLQEIREEDDDLGQNSINVRWDYQKELEQQKLTGRLKLSEKLLSEMEIESNQKEVNKSSKKTKNIHI